MRLAFLCSSLEPGRDGVGDYTTLLAQECVRQGHMCCAIALADPGVTEAQVTTKFNVPLLRLPVALSWPSRIGQAQRLLEEFAPEWVSLQFVPYAFHPKGIVCGLGSRLQPLVSGRRVHVMFHETWVGVTNDCSTKQRITGKVQRHFVRQMLKQVRASVVHTSNEAYVSVLQKEGIPAERLPMFGAIPLTERHDDEWPLAELRGRGLEISLPNRNQFWLFGFFGALHPHWPPEPLFGHIARAAKQQGRQVVLLSIGGMGGGEVVWDDLKRQYGTQFEFLRLGRQPADKVSMLFHCLDFGLATSPWSLIGKSSSVAAMLEHGLPVIVNRDDAIFPAAPVTTSADEPLLMKTEDDLAAKLSWDRPRWPAVSRLPGAAAQLIARLSA